MHALDPPRKYRTIFVCDGFGLGSTRERDEQALRRFHEYLEPGGTLAFDIEVPYSSGYPWRYWRKEEREGLPRAWKPPGETERRPGSDGAEYALQSRVADFDPLEQQLTYEMRAEMWHDGELEREEEHTLHINLYFKHELLLMLERAGFADVDVRGGHNDQPPTGDDDFLVLIATTSAQS
jgi:hypothetical protein